MVLSAQTKRKLERVIREHRAILVIRDRGLSPRRKLLLIGNPGTGKTLTASVLAKELGLPLFVVRLDGLITKFMGETAAKLRLIFEAINQTRGVYLFDEFDSIGSARGLSNDVGEIRRVLNSFLQMVEQDNSDSLVVAATNRVGVLDRALFRRFDDVIEYDLPDGFRIVETLKSKLGGFKTQNISWAKAATISSGRVWTTHVHDGQWKLTTPLSPGRHIFTIERPGGGAPQRFFIYRVGNGSDYDRIAERGGNTGLIQVTLAWDDTNDLDLVVECPDKSRIFFGKRDNCGGSLDVDANASAPLTNTPAENISWSARPAPGTYNIHIVFYHKNAGDMSAYRLHVLIDDKTVDKSGTISSEHLRDFGQAVYSFTIN